MARTCLLVYVIALGTCPAIVAAQEQYTVTVKNETGEDVFVAWERKELKDEFGQPSRETRVKGWYKVAHGDSYQMTTFTYIGLAVFQNGQDYVKRVYENKSDRKFLVQSLPIHPQLATDISTHRTGDRYTVNVRLDNKNLEGTMRQVGKANYDKFLSDRGIEWVRSIIVDRESATLTLR